MPAADDPIVVSGVGVVTALGTGRTSNFERLCQGKSGVAPIRRFETSGLSTRFAACVEGLPEGIPAQQRTLLMAHDAGDEAVAMAGLQSFSGVPAQAFLAISPGEIEWDARVQARRASHAAGLVGGPADDWRASQADLRERLHSSILNAPICEHLSRRYGLTRQPVAANTACASGASAIQLAAESIRTGYNEAALVLGTDSTIWPEGLVRFSLLSALSTRNDEPAAASRPFSADRDGFVMGEGAGAMVLERMSAARARGARPLAIVAGCGDATDNFHRTRSHPSGETIVASMRRAIEDAGLCPDDIDYINAHGTSTPENDKMEAQGIHLLFGSHAGRLLVSSNKSMIGHTLTACGVIEAIFTVLSLDHSVAPPTINHVNPDPSIDLDVVPNQPRAKAISFAISNSFGFGGQNVSLLFARPEALQ